MVFKDILFSIKSLKISFKRSAFISEVLQKIPFKKSSLVGIRMTQQKYSEMKKPRQFLD
jgi:hypothetical protein